MRRFLKTKSKEIAKNIKLLINRYIFKKINSFISNKLRPPYDIYNNFNEFKSIYKQEFSVKTLFNGENISFKPINTLQSDIHKNFVDDSFYYPDDYILTIPNARVYGINGLVITPDNKVLDRVNIIHSHVGPINDNEIFSRFIMPALEHKKENIAVLTSLFSDFYYHWMLDILPKFYMLEMAGIKPDYYVLNHQNKAFQRYTLERIGIPEEKIIQTTPDMYIQAENLIIPSIPGITGFDPKWAIEYIRSLFLNKTISSDYPKRFYINRKKAFSRRFVNDKEVCNLLEKYGFKEVILEDLNVKEQASIFYNADMIFAPHGGGLTNLIFSRENTGVIEVFSPSMPIPCYRTLASMQNLDYYHIMADCPSKSFKKDGCKYNKQDIIADINLLEETIKLALKS